MNRVEQPEGKRGSLKWLQHAVNHYPNVLDGLILSKVPGARSIYWRSPLKSDAFAEYRDAAFLKKIGAENLTRPLADFWPSRGPQWDALGCSDQSDAFLIEAKAHIRELCSAATQASASSREKIRGALNWTSQLLHAKPRAPWTDLFYQLANRIAHLCFLRKHGLKAWLVLINFVGDDDMQGPSTEEEWRGAYQVAWYVLGIPQNHPYRSYIIDIYPRVTGLQS